MTERLMSSDPTPPIHSIVDKDDGTSWYRGTGGLWFCISKDHDEEGVRWGQLAGGARRNRRRCRGGPSNQ